MTNWEDDGYCDAARDFHDARRVCQMLGVPLHRVNFAREYREHVFAHFLDEHRKGRTPNPDVLCNREIKFGVMRALRAAARRGANRDRPLRTTRRRRGGRNSCKARDSSKDQSYFLAAVDAADFTDVLFPLGDLLKSDVREIARRAGLPVADKKDSTGICFIGERPFAEFLAQYLPPSPGKIVDDRGRERRQPRRARVLHARPAPRPAHRRRRGRRRGAVVRRAQGRGAQRARRRPGPRSSAPVRRPAHRERRALDRRAAPSTSSAARRGRSVAARRFATASPIRLCTVVRTGERDARGELRSPAAHADAGPVRRLLRRRPLPRRRGDRSSEPSRAVPPRHRRPGLSLPPPSPPDRGNRRHRNGTSRRRLIQPLIRPLGRCQLAGLIRQSTHRTIRTATTRHPCI